MNQGKIVEIIGAVVDVEFPHNHVPKIYDALNVEEENLVLEVQQQIGDGVVRTIAMGTTDGLRRGLDCDKYWQTYHGSSWQTNSWSHHECIR